MITKWYSIPDVGNGTITHEDQEVNGLKFVGVSNKDVFMFAVSGETANIEQWASRNNCTEITQEEYNTIIQAPTAIEQRIADIELALAALMGGAV